MKKEFDIDKCWYKQNKKCLYNKNEVTLLSNEIDTYGQVVIKNEHNNFCTVPAIYLENITNYKEYWVYFLRESTLDNLTLDIKISPCVFLSKEEALCYAEKQINLQNSSLPLLKKVELIDKPINIYTEEIIYEEKIKDTTKKEKWINIFKNSFPQKIECTLYDSYEEASKGRADIFEYVCDPVKVRI